MHFVAGEISRNGKSRSARSNEPRCHLDGRWLKSGWVSSHNRSINYSELSNLMNLCKRSGSERTVCSWLWRSISISIFFCTCTVFMYLHSTQQILFIYAWVLIGSWPTTGSSIYFHPMFATSPTDHVAGQLSGSSAALLLPYDGCAVAPCKCKAFGRGNAQVGYGCGICPPSQWFQIPVQSHGSFMKFSESKPDMQDCWIWVDQPKSFVPSDGLSRLWLNSTRPTAEPQDMTGMSFTAKDHIFGRGRT